MRILGRDELMKQALLHGDCVKQVERWANISGTASWHSLADVRATFSHADGVGSHLVFNIKGNKYRLIVDVNYRLGIIVFEALLTHAEYDKGRWKH
jgi:mRNA interferase HigB